MTEQFNPDYESVCWNCKIPIDSLPCLRAGHDETGSLGWECTNCGKHLGHRNTNDDGTYKDFEISDSLNEQILQSM